ncbi:hypothetical protein ACEQ8H_007618 [Pleosporales sp. CAS-2024a]
MPYFTELASKAGYVPMSSYYDTLLKPQPGKTVLVAHWPGDATSQALIAALKKLLPKPHFAAHGLTHAYIFDVYGLPDLAAHLAIDFVPCLMWYRDGVQDALVWHQGVMVQGETIEKGVGRVVERIKGSHQLGADSDSDW